MRGARFRLVDDRLLPEDVEAAVRSLRSGRYTMGEAVRDFEDALARWVGVTDAVMVNSGSSANLLLVDSLLRRLDPARQKLFPGDEVLVPALAWSTTVWPIQQLGLVPVYADVDPATLGLSLDSAATILSPRTRALFLIHPLGRACAMEPYVAFCARHDLVLIEDCCESFGAHDAGRHVGTFGYGGTLSHFYSHHLTTIEGGTLLTDDRALADDLRSARAHGWIRDRSDRERLAAAHPALDPRFLFVLPGYNVRPVEAYAAIGAAQLGRMDADLAAREALARRVLAWVEEHVPWLALLGADCLETAPAGRRDRRHSWMTLPFLIDRKAPRTVESVKAKLEGEGVETRPILAGNLLRHPAATRGQMRSAGILDGADSILERGFMIGCHPHPAPESLETLERAIASLGTMG